jgi:hypothetical protein
MANDFNLGNYECPSPPPILWHVTHRQSQSKIDKDKKDVVAADSSRGISNKSELKEAFEEHIKWENREPTCLVSVFCDMEHTFQWAKLRKDVSISWIDTTKLPTGTCLFDATFLSKTLNAPHPFSKDELLFLHCIPGESITDRQTLEEFEESCTCGVATNHTWDKIH